MRGQLTNWFLRHELWALDNAEKFPILSIFFAATLWVWILPFLPILIASSLMVIKWPLAGFAPNLILGLGFLFFVVPWFIRWYFICFGLVFGKRKMASAKRDNLMQRLST